MVTDKDKLEIQIELLYIAPQHLSSIEATEVEIEIRNKLELFKKWSLNLIKQKLI